MTTLQESNESMYNLNLHRDYCHNRNSVEAFSELISNARSADPTNQPVIQHDTLAKKVLIKDCGLGIKKEHFAMGNSQGEGHSHHGIGLKDAIVILRRDYNATITIRSGETCFTFAERKGELNVATLHLIVRDGFENIRGTQIEIEYTTPRQEDVSEHIDKARASFFVHLKDTVDLVATNEYLDMYVPKNGAGPFDFVFVSGARKGTARKLRCIYNLKGTLAETAKCLLNRDHNFSSKRLFDEAILSKIKEFAVASVKGKSKYRHLKSYEFESPKKPRRKVVASLSSTLSAAAPPQSPVSHSPATQPSPIAVVLEVEPGFHRSLANQVFASLDEQNSAMITLSPGERKQVGKASDAIQKKLKTLGLSIAAIRYSGSIAKSTAVPHSVDVDLVVFLKKFDPSKVADYARKIQTGLASRECRFLSSAPDILECVYASINIDIVLTSADEINHPRYEEFQDGPEAVTYFKKEIVDNAWVAEVVRAAKFWVMRCNDDDSLRVKSLTVELVVLEVFKANKDECASRSTKDNRKELFLSFLRFLTRPLVEQCVPHLLEEKQQVFDGIKQPLQRYKRLAEAALEVLDSL